MGMFVQDDSGGVRHPVAQRHTIERPFERGIC